MKTHGDLAAKTKHSFADMRVPKFNLGTRNWGKFSDEVVKFICRSDATGERELRKSIDMSRLRRLGRWSYHRRSGSLFYR
jgi:hypothetical protein